MKYLSWLRKHKWLSIPILLVVAVVLIALGAVVYNKIATELNRRAFQQANYAIETIYNDIVKEVGPPDDNKRESRCSRSRGEFSEGPLGCYTSMFFIYGLSNKDQSDLTIKRIRSIIVNSQSILVAASSSTESSGLITKAPGNTSSTDYYQAPGRIKCRADYAFDTSYGSFLKLKDPDAKPLAINISCSGMAMEDYFSSI